MSAPSYYPWLRRDSISSTISLLCNHVLSRVLLNFNGSATKPAGMTSTGMKMTYTTVSKMTICMVPRTLTIASHTFQDRLNTLSKSLPTFQDIHNIVYRLVSNCQSSNMHFVSKSTQRFPSNSHSSQLLSDSISSSKLATQVNCPECLQQCNSQCW